MLSIKVDPIATDIELLINRDLSPEAQSQALAELAKSALVDAQTVNEQAVGRAVAHQTFVDGVAGAPETSVRPDGTILYEFELVEELLVWIGEQLVLHAPVKSGRFAKSFVMLADGEEVTLGDKLVDAVEYVFTNTQPYARKIEGDDNRAPESPQAPDGVFEVVAKQANQRFGNIAKITFGLRSLEGAGALEEWAGSESAKKLGKRRGSTPAKQHDWLTRQPSIIVTVK